MPKLISVGNFPDSIAAHIAKGLLEANDILCFLENDGLINRSPELSIAYGGVSLKVREQDAEKAKKLLSDTQEIL